MRGLLLPCLAACSIAAAQDNIVPGRTLGTLPTIDGTIGSDEWKDAAGSEGAFDETTGGSAPETMRFWIAYDQNFIYFACKAFDAQPNSIRATEYRTNVSLSGDDSISLLLDLSGSLADFNAFGMNPRGATQIELAGGRAAKREWSGEFVAKGRIVEDGWEVEARIPWQIMRLPSAGPRTVRFNVSRGHQRTQRSYVWRYTGFSQPEKNGRWTAVDIPKAPFERTLKLLPYGIAGANRNERILEGGMDLKTQLADQMSLVGSLNPDFRNIENAILSLDFSRFERLSDETRPFFQEGNQYMNSALYASQRIRDFDAGINVHGKLTDRISFGVLDTVDFGTQNNLVANVSYDPNSRESYRLTATNLAREGLTNEAYLLRYARQFGPMNLFVRNMSTRDSASRSGLYNSVYLQNFENGLYVFAGYDAVSPSFLPRLGFIPETGFKGPSAGFQLSRPASKGLVREVELEMFWLDYQKYDGGRYRDSLDLSGNLLLSNGVGLRAGSSVGDFEGTQDQLYFGSITFPRGNPYRYVSMGVQSGRQANRDYRSVSASAAYRPIEKIQLTARFQQVTHFGKDNLGIFGFNYDLGRDNYFSGRLVKRDADWSGYASFRHSGNRGTEYFLIFGDPNSRTFQQSLILKVVWPIEVR